MTGRLGRSGRLARAARLAGAALFLVLCGHAAFTARARNRDAAPEPSPAACEAVAPCRPPCAAVPQG